MIVIIIIGLIGLLFVIEAGSLLTGSMKILYIGVFNDWLRKEVICWCLPLKQAYLIDWLDKEVNHWRVE